MLKRTYKIDDTLFDFDALYIDIAKGYEGVTKEDQQKAIHSLTEFIAKLSVVKDDMRLGRKRQIWIVESHEHNQQ